MRVVSTPYELQGRADQKRRTRDALVAAARRLVEEGETPTVEEAAAAARVSRTTAYRYFPTQRDLLVTAHPEIAGDSLLPDDPPTDPAERLDLVVTAFAERLLSTEAQQRAMLRLSLGMDHDRHGHLALRQGRAITWISDALQPLTEELGPDGVRSLAIAIRSAVGVEALSWQTDVAGLSREDAVRIMLWTARALLHVAVQRQPPPIVSSARIADIVDDESAVP